MDFHIILIVALVAAALELDNYYIGMLIVSQPIVTGGLIGLITGDPITGILIGVLVQLIWANNPPVGAHVPPSSSAIAACATVFAVGLSEHALASGPAPVIVFSLIIGVVFGYFTGQADIWNRKLNTIILHKFEKKILEGKSGYLGLTQFFAVGSKFLRDFTVMFLFFAAGVPVALDMFTTLPFQVVRGFDIVYWALPALGFAVIFNLYRTKVGGYVHGILLFGTLLAYKMAGSLNPVFTLIFFMVAGSFVVYFQVWKKKAA